nr:site-specific integrase [Bacillus alveayuensis]
MKEQLKKYLGICGALDHDYLFISVDDTPLTKRQMQAQIESYGKNVVFMQLVTNSATPLPDFQWKQEPGYSNLCRSRSFVNGND